MLSRMAPYAMDFTPSDCQAEASICYSCWVFSLWPADIESSNDTSNDTSNETSNEKGSGLTTL